MISVPAARQRHASIALEISISEAMIIIFTPYLQMGISTGAIMYIPRADTPAPP